MIQMLYLFIFKALKTSGMYKLFPILFTLVVLASCKTTTYYVVRHAEKETTGPNMSGDAALSAAGKERAAALKQKLEGKVEYIASTNTKRTMSTAEPLSIPGTRNIHIYAHTDTAFLSRLKQGNTNSLIIGHSNTVDDVVNFLMGKKVLSDLSESSYGDLFIVKKKSGKFSFSQERFGN